MRVVLAAVGRLKDGPERLLCTRYLDRARDIGRRLGIRAVDTLELDESPDRSADGRRDAEARAMLTRLPGQAGVIAFDEHGALCSSREFAAHIARLRDGGMSDLALVIGGPDGLGPGLRDRAALRLAFGPATFPHGLVRVMAAEQLYRALTILAGHPYHRD